jgi:Pyrimidine deaminase
VLFLLNFFVGVVVVFFDGKVVGSVHYLCAGAEYVEVVAFGMVGDVVRGGLFYVMLEFCNYYGKMLFCVDTILTTNIKKIFIRTHDPNPHINNNNIKQLKKTNIKITLNITKKNTI